MTPDEGKMDALRAYLERDELDVVFGAETVDWCEGSRTKARQTRSLGTIEEDVIALLASLLEVPANRATVARWVAEGPERVLELACHYLPEAEPNPPTVPAERTVHARAAQALGMTPGQYGKWLGVSLRHAARLIQRGGSTSPLHDTLADVVVRRHDAGQRDLLAKVIAAAPRARWRSISLLLRG